ncbi:MAG: hypothetical protein SWI22_08850 [Pseudomonadota bacterium]|nr:hypothetical protein [Pseudomonadota bacterium]
MLTRIGIAVCALSMIAPAVSLAQSAPVQRPPGLPPVIQPYDRMNPERMQAETFNRALTTQASVSPARAARAERVAALINEGRCEDAVALARAENDRRLARRAETLCKPAEGTNRSE